MTEHHPRIFIERPPSADGRATLGADRGHYLIRVLRLKHGDHVIGFWGTGVAHLFQIVGADPRRCLLESRGVVAEDPPAAARLHLAQALLKGERLDWVIQKAAELGATDVWLIQAEHGEVHIDERRLETRLNHWQKVIVAACEQCGRLTLPTLHAPQTFESLINGVHAATSLLLHPGAPVLATTPARVDTLLAVGPEGGWSDRETATAVAGGYTPMGLGPHVLRADTAPVVALAIIRQAWAWR